MQAQAKMIFLHFQDTFDGFIFIKKQTKKTQNKTFE